MVGQGGDHIKYLSFVSKYSTNTVLRILSLLFIAHTLSETSSV